MDGYVIERADGRADGEEWAEDYERLPGGANVWLIIDPPPGPASDRAFIGTRTPRRS